MPKVRPGLGAGSLDWMRGLGRPKPRDRGKAGRRLHAAPARMGLARVAFVCAAVLAAAVAGAALAQDLRFFRIGTGTTGGTYFPVGGLIANAVSNPPGSRPCDRGGSCGVPGLIAVAQATSGSVENLEKLSDQVFESALSQADVAYWAYRGEGPYEGMAPQEGLRAIANLYPETVHLVVRADSGIDSVDDLEGRIVSVGEEGSGTLIEARLVLDAYGLDEDDVETRSLRPGPAGDRLADGEIDAFFLVAGQPVGAVADVAARVPIRLLPLDGVAERLGGDLPPFLVEMKIEAGTYEGVPETPTLAVGAQWIVRSDVDEDIVHGLAQALWHPSTLRLLAAGHPRGSEIRPGKATEGLAVPLHPGAERYYREAGLLDGGGEERPAVPAGSIPFPGIPSPEVLPGAGPGQGADDAGEAPVDGEVGSRDGAEDGVTNRSPRAPPGPRRTTRAWPAAPSPPPHRPGRSRRARRGRS
jgi:uncharacterized protein